MADLEIDYSHVPNPLGVEASRWKAPRHVYFGRKLEDGTMEDEPTYVHKDFPSLRYALQGNKIVARQVENAAELAELGDEWKDTPAAFGYVSAPSFEDAAAKKSGLEVKRGPGRPPKNG